MPRTRSSKSTKPPSNEANTTSDTTPSQSTSTSSALPPSVANPPKLFVLPKSASHHRSRIVTLENPANGTPSRYLFCPDSGFYEFTRLAAPKRQPRSWLLTTENEHNVQKNMKEEEETGEDEGRGERGDGGLGSAYITRSPDLFVATPIDTLFLLLPALAPKSPKQAKQHFLSFDDHMDALTSSNRHLRALLAQHPFLRAKMEKRMAACCDTVDAGEEPMYRLSTEKLLVILVKKAERICKAGFPKSMEDQFVKPALEMPVMSVRREETSISIVSTTTTSAADEQDTIAPIVVAEAAESQSSTTTTTTTTTTTPTATPSSDSQTTALTTPEDDPPPLTTPPSIPPLLRLRTAITYLLNAYIPLTLHTPLLALLSSSPNLPSFTPLDTHLATLSKLKAQAAALRSISDNMSRKRGYDDDDEEKMAEREEKKRKREEEERRRKSESRGVRQLKKVDTSGMKKLSAFFTKVPAKK
ncbi:uncharacterized protein EI97DRAFT_429876 [Westerdykella ornata]|uniref:Ribonuclease H2 subunit B n=1 Tax=Westerdykella ornata TaxID=318751 RepID=A0A6A6JU60_WESOR|nr:uncharacterized protein EI97DRAFT_429876 [Westerdykella ornata]KAF2280112.1 hypothetical protein EI97DRAFT_429876 [Westerdykella ornata]